MARNMVTKWGLTEKMGPVLYGEDESQAPGGGNTHYSEDTSREIDQEVRQILDHAYIKAKSLLEDYRDVLETMKDALMEYETIDADQVDDLMKRIQVRPPRRWDDDDFNGEPGGESGGNHDKKTSGTGPIGGAVEGV
jgi:cell division protease FtsH